MRIFLSAFACLLFLGFVPTVYAQDGFLTRYDLDESYEEEASLPLTSDESSPVLSLSPVIKPPVQKSGALTLNQALRGALVNNPGLQAVRVALDAVREAEIQAQANWKPTLSGTAGAKAWEVDVEGGSGGGHGVSKDLGLSLSQPVFRGGRTMAQISGADLRTAYQEALLEQEVQKLLLSVVQAYMGLVRDGALIDLNEANHELLIRQHEAATARFEVGEITRTDLAQAKARLSKAKADYVAAQGVWEGTAASFEQITGLGAQRISVSPLLPVLPSNLPASLALASDKNTAIQAAIYAQVFSDEDRALIAGELLPEVTLGASVDHSYDPASSSADEQTTSSLGLSMSVPLYQGGAVRSRIRAAKHTVNQRALELEQVKREVEENVKKAWAALETARAEMISREAQVEASSLAREGAFEESFLGSRSVLESLDADQDYLEAQVDLIEAQHDEVVAAFSLLESIGSLSITD